MNIAIVDDHLMLAQSLRESLRKTIKNSDVRLFTKPHAFLAFDFTSWHPDLVIADILMPEISGLVMIERAKPLLSQSCKFIVLSTLSDPASVKSALRTGAKGYITKSSSIDELFEAIEAVSAGKQFINQSLKEDLLNAMLADEKPADVDLSPREKEVLQRVCSGRTPKEIAFDMNLSLNTIQLYNNAILRKFNLNRTIDLVAYAIQKGIYKKPDA